MIDKISLRWSLIRSFIESGVSKYVYAVPSVSLILFSFDALPFGIADYFINASVISQYVAFACVYSFCGVIYYIYCPDVIRAFISKYDFVRNGDTSAGPEDLGRMRAELKIIENLSDKEVFRKYYELQDRSCPKIRAAFSVVLVMSALPVMVMTIVKLFNHV